MGAQVPGQAWISRGKEVPQREGRKRGGDRKSRSVCEGERSEPEKEKCVGVTEGKRAQRRDQWRGVERRRERERITQLAMLRFQKAEVIQSGRVF